MDVETIETLVNALTQLGEYSLWGFILWLFFALVPKILWFVLGITLIIMVKQTIQFIVEYHSEPDDEFFLSLRSKIIRNMDYGKLTNAEKRKIKEEITNIINQHKWDKNGKYIGYVDNPNTPEQLNETH